MKGKNEAYEFDQQWLVEAEKRMRPDIQTHLAGEQTYPAVRARFSFTGDGKRGVGKVGQTWPAEASEDGVVEMIVPLDEDDPVRCMAFLRHQMVHAVVGRKHDQNFVRLALKVGFDDRQGGIRRAVPTEDLRKKLVDLASELGPMPRRKLNYAYSDAAVADKPKPQTGRMLKAFCKDPDEDGACKFLVRMSSGTAKEYGIPLCPRHQKMLTLEAPKDTSCEPENLPTDNGASDKGGDS